MSDSGSDSDDLVRRPREPVLPKARDGIYPRCVWCRGEIYALAVIAYSAGEVPCAAARPCGRKLPADYIVEGNDDD